MASGPAVLRIRTREMQIMLDHVRSLQAEEVCGLLGGDGQEVRMAIPVENIAHSPTRFRMEPRGQLHAMQAIEDAGLELVGIFHSHPVGPSGLSSQDLREAAFLEAAYLIWSPGEHGWICHAFRLDESGPRSIAIIDPVEEA
ncbi:MAG: hypothetical protein A2Z37_14285 [Chloroflexi bacterium RBG_19FT_COMBO_62_14]|nr:MAG: hypothetical protein A2Z37_14285 [Chloroflexi bacterium RBG_19FT_COMBO_62_14]